MLDTVSRGVQPGRTAVWRDRTTLSGRIRVKRDAAREEIHQQVGENISWTRAAREDMSRASPRDNFSRHPRARTPSNT
jgi:hypothetical protein